MKTFTHTKTGLIGALALAAAPVSAASPQDCFVQLASPISQTALPRSEANLPLTLLPAQTEGGIFIPGLGEKMLQMSQGVAPEDVKLIESVGSAAVSAGPGTVQMLQDVFMIIMNVQTVEQLASLEDRWLDVVKPDYSLTIKETLEAEIKRRSESVQKLIRELKLAPIYAAVSAAPGHEEDFDRLYDLVVQQITDSATDPTSAQKGIKLTKGDNRLVVEIPRAAIMSDILSQGECGAPGVGALSKYGVEALSEGSLYLLVQKQGKSVYLLLCSAPDELVTSAGPTESLIDSPMLHVPDAALPLQQLLGTVWVAPEFSVMQSSVCSESSIAALSGAVSLVFDKLASTDSANARAFSSASAGLKKLITVIFPQPKGANIPSKLAVWQGQDEIRVILTGDALGYTYQPASLRAASLAAAPETALYVESTPITTPNLPNYDGSLNTVLSVAKELTLTTDEQVQDAIAPSLQQAEGYVTDLLALGDAVQTVFSGLEAPCSLLLSCEQMSPSPTLPVHMEGQVMPAIALSSGVKNRAVLSDGWQKLVAAVQQGSVKMGAQPNLISMLPIMPRPLAGSAVSYMLVLPLFPGFEPQLTVSDKSFVLGTSSSLNNKMLTLESSSGIPFCGAAARVNFAPLAQALREINSLSSYGQHSKCKSPLDLVSETVSDITGVIVVHDGTMVSQWSIHTK